MKLNELAYFIVNADIEIIDGYLPNGEDELFKGNIVEFNRNKDNFKNYIVGAIFHNINGIEIYVKKVGENEK